MFNEKSMERPGWERLMTAMRSGSVWTVVCWKLDRLGLPARKAATFLGELGARGCRLVSIRDELCFGPAEVKARAGRSSA